MFLQSDNERVFSAFHLLVISLFTLCVLLAVASLSIRGDIQDIQAKFNEEAAQIQHFFSQRISSLETVLISLAGLHHSSDDLNIAEFGGFTQEILSAYPYIDAIIRADRVKMDNVESYIDGMIETGFVGFKLKNFDSTTQSPLPLNEYLPVSFIEPSTPVSAQIIGYDLATAKSAMHAIHSAITTGNIFSSGPVQHKEAGKPFFLIFKAIYLGRYPPTTEHERQDMLTGLVAIKINPHIFFSGISLNKQHLSVSVTDTQGKTLPLNGRADRQEPAWFKKIELLTSQQQVEAYGQMLTISLSRTVGIEAINIWKLSTTLIVIMAVILLSLGIYAVKRVAVIREERSAIALFEEGERFAQVVNTAFDAVITTNNEGVVLSWNQKAEKIFGIESQQAEGQLLIPLILASESILQHGESLSRSFHDSSLNETSYQIELTGKYSDGREFPLELSISKSVVGEKIIHSVFARDISERKTAENRIRQLAYHDSLTELPNRQSFKIQTDQAIKLAVRNNRMGAVLFIDLDEFKRINDTLGHDIGDLLIKRVAERLVEQIRGNDSVSHTTTEGIPSQNVARLGGDEFTILLSEIKHIDDAGIVAQRIQHSIDGVFNLKGYEVYITPSIGIAVFPNDGKGVDEVLKNADTAMYHAKAVGKNNFQFYSEQMGANAAEYLKLGALLRKALSNNEMKLYYQPQISASSGKITGAEALLRWEQAELGMISPADFIPLAEDTGMILDIGDWVLRQACLDNAQWQNSGYPSIRVAVNLSGLQFIQKDLHFKVQQALENAGLAPQYLELEITESIIMRNIDETISTLQSFRNMNLGISVDDFGTGYSSLSYLKKFPLETLKIDRSFVTDIPEDNDDVKITSAILAMARSLNLKVVAEGVETEAQAAFLRQHHCDLLQGYLYSKPLPKNEFEQLLASEKTWDLSDDHQPG